MPKIACMASRSFGTVRPMNFVRDLRRGQMIEVQEQVEIVQEEETEIVELTLVDLQRIGGGAGNAAIDF